MKKFIDLSLPLQEGMVIWPGDIKFKREEIKTSSINSRLNISTHHGTHIDAPRHFLFNNRSVEKIDLEKLVGKARIIEVAAKNLIEVKHLPKDIKAGDKLLFKTRNSRLLRKKQFDENYVSLSLEAAKHLTQKKIDLVGVDYYGVEAKGASGHPVHKALLKAGIVIVEGLNLQKAKPGVYSLAVLPLRLIGADGSPARAIIWQ